MSSSIVNAAPMAVMLGIEDLSTRAVAVAPEEIPTHLPKVYLYTKKGPTGPQLVGGAGLAQMYGADSFDLRKPWANHQTVLSNTLSAKGNAQMIERMLPDDMGPKANLLLSLDVVPFEVPQYQRGSDGRYIKDPITGLPLPVSPAATVTGFKCKWVVSHRREGGVNDADGTVFGTASVTPGDQTFGDGISTRYPIFEFWASSFGAFANNAGIRISAPNVNSDTPVNTSVLNSLKAYPFRFSAISRLNATSTPTISSMISGDKYFDFALLPGAINPYTTGQMYLGDVLPSAYQSIGVPGYVDIIADLGKFHIYQNNIDDLVNQFYAAEKNFTGAGSDFTAGADDEKWKFNFISGMSSEAAPYYSFMFNTEDADAVTLNENTNLYAAGGSDGTMDNAKFASLVSTAVSQYLDPLTSLMDTAVNVESIVYDTGFPLETKYALINFISQRKDTFVVLSTYDVDGPELTSSDESALSIALRTRLQLFPESTYFGTPIVRGLVMGRYGKLLNSQYTGNLPLTIELASKAAAMMGAGNGVWKKQYLFDSDPNSVLTMFQHNTVNIVFVPGQQRNKDWANGLNYPLSYSRNSLFFPAMKTAYSDDTSVLTSFFTAMGCVELEKIGEQTWRKYSGNVSLTSGQLIDAVNKTVTDRVQGKFAGLFKIIPNAYITGGDEQRGYSYTLPIDLYANNSKTVATVYLRARRMSDLPAA